MAKTAPSPLQILGVRPTRLHRIFHKPFSSYYAPGEHDGGRSLAEAHAHVNGEASLSLGFKSINENDATQFKEIENVSRHEGGQP
ncbi:hypothetical protein [Pseudomonas carnis]|uniref:hypothetical protein n=1 Tax=Pseudomonas carnis TaxID=2487355 RepID=UPI0015E2A575|nr:hypothetical protein [Pseudomonas carnis]MBA1299354.1 hypothetical protein [Pseudomonas carnis]